MKTRSSFRVLFLFSLSTIIILNSCKKEYDSSIECKLIEVTQLVSTVSALWTYTYDSQGRLSMCISPGGTSPNYHNFVYNPIVTETSASGSGAIHPYNSQTFFGLNTDGFAFFSITGSIDSLYIPQLVILNIRCTTEYAYTNNFLTYVKNDVEQISTSSSDTTTYYTRHSISRTISNENCVFQVDSFLSGDDQNALDFDWLDSSKFTYTNLSNNQNLDFANNSLSPSIAGTMTGTGSGYNSRIFGRPNKNLLSRKNYTAGGTPYELSFQYELNQYNYISKYTIIDSSNVISYSFKYKCN